MQLEILSEMRQSTVLSIITHFLNYKSLVLVPNFLHVPHLIITKFRFIPYRITYLVFIMFKQILCDQYLRFKV